METVQTRVHQLESVWSVPACDRLLLKKVTMNKDQLLFLATWLCIDVVSAACSNSITLTRPDSRYEIVANTSFAGSEVKDKVTGLIWQRCLVGKKWNGSNCILDAAMLNKITYTWANALEMARTATPTSATPATAWRVPNHAELYSLSERACSGPAINSVWFPDTDAWKTWSSSPLSNYPTYAWVINFDNGNDDGVAKGLEFHVRLVRSSQ